MAKFTSDFVTLSKKVTNNVFACWVACRSANIPNQAGKVKGVTEKEANAALSMATTKINNGKHTLARLGFFGLANSTVQSTL